MMLQSGTICLFDCLLRDELCCVFSSYLSVFVKETMSLQGPAALSSECAEQSLLSGCILPKFPCRNIYEC